MRNAEGVAVWHLIMRGEEEEEGDFMSDGGGQAEGKQRAISAF